MFDYAFNPYNGKRYIHHMGHIKMMPATQPFLSGAISKTVNLPSQITSEEIAETYLKAWKYGLKAIAVYRDGCKRSQPLNTSKNISTTGSTDTSGQPFRKKLPEERNAITHKFSIGGHEGYITVGMFAYGTPGEIFLVMSEEGTVVSAKLMKDRVSGRYNGFGFVEMSADDEAKKAVEELNGKELDGRSITVNEARPKEDKPRNNNYNNNRY